MTTATQTYPITADPIVTYPINVVVTGRRCLVIGGGRVAVGKAAGLRRAGADVTVIAPRITAELTTDPDLMCHRRRYRREDLEGALLVITCTDDPAVNAAVAADGARAGVLVNSADDPVNCDYILPSVARLGPLQIALSTGGLSPAMASWLRRRFEAMAQSEDWTALVELLAEVRSEARNTIGTSELDGWAEAFEEGVAGLVAEGRIDEARRLLRSRLGLA